MNSNRFDLALGRESSSTPVMDESASQMAYGK